MLKKRNKGFTLIELMVVLSIMGILMALSLVSYQGARKSARDGRRKADLEQVRSALEMRRADCGSYPVLIRVSGENITGDQLSGTCLSSTIYITIPSDPFPGRQYYYNGSADSYSLCTAVEIGGGGIPTGCAVANSCGAGILCNYKLTQP